VLPEPRSERPVVRLELPAPQLLRFLDEAQLLHVQLVTHEIAEALDRPALPRRRHDHGLAERLAHLQLPVRAGRAAQLDRVARDLHLPFEVRVARARLREVAQMHGRL